MKIVTHLNYVETKRIKKSEKEEQKLSGFI